MKKYSVRQQWGLVSQAAGERGPPAEETESGARPVDVTFGGKFEREKQKLKLRLERGLHVLVDQPEGLIRVLDPEPGNNNVDNRDQKNKNEDDVVEDNGGRVVAVLVNVEASDDHEQNGDDQLKEKSVLDGAEVGAKARGVENCVFGNGGVETRNDQIEDGYDESENRSDVVEEVCGGVVVFEVQPAIPQQMQAEAQQPHGHLRTVNACKACRQGEVRTCRTIEMLIKHSIRM
jgi:hypothetical protein